MLSEWAMKNWLEGWFPTITINDGDTCWYNNLCMLYCNLVFFHDLFDKDEQALRQIYKIVDRMGREL